LASAVDGAALRSLASEKREEDRLPGIYDRRGILSRDEAPDNDGDL